MKCSQDSSTGENPFCFDLGGQDAKNLFNKDKNCWKPMFFYVPPC